MKRKLLTNTLMVLMIMAVMGSLLPAISYAAEHTFTWESATDLGSTVEETVGGITVTVSGIHSETGGVGRVWRGIAGLSIESLDWLQNITFSFSKPVDIIRIYAKNGYLDATWTYTPTGGSNVAITDNIPSNTGHIVNLNWTEVTSFTVTSTLVENSFGFDNLVIRTPSLAHNVAGDSKVFSELTAGYSDGSRENLTVEVTSTKTNNNITATLSGDNPDSFTLTENLTTLDNGQTGTFSIMPNNGLAPGTYNATVTIRSDEFPAGVSFTVQQRVIKAEQAVITYNDVNKTYGDGPFNHTASGGSGSGAFSYTSSDTDVATIDASTGSVTILKAGTTTLTATKAGDGTYNEATDTCILTINKKALTATATADNKTYDGNTTATGSITLSGIVGADDVTATGAFNFADANAGESKTVNVTGIILGGAKAGNYTVNDTATTADITPKMLIATATANDKTYDGNITATGTIDLAGIVGDDEVTASGTFAFVDSTVGIGKTVNVTGIMIGGADAGNYSLSNTTATAIANIAAIVTFDSRGGSQVAGITGVTYGSTISAPAAPTRPGYNFGGWYKEPGCNNAWDFTNDIVTDNLTLYAKWIWIPIPTYTVTYAGNGNDSGSVPVDSNNYQQGATVTVLSNTGNLARSGYTLAGWNTASDGSGTDYTAMGSANVTLYAQWTQITAAPQITTQPVDQTITVGQTATFSVTVVGSAPLSYQWQKDGIDISGATSSSLIITNAQASDAGSYTCLISNTAGSITSRAATLTINSNALTIITENLPGGTVGKTYSTTLTASGGDQPYSWSAIDLPPGLNICQTGIINGAPSAAGTYTVVATVEDNGGQSASQAFSLIINATDLEIITGILPAGTENTSYSKRLSARGGTAPYTWSAAGLPPGMAISSNGEISGIPSAAGIYHVTVTVQDSGGQSVSQTYNITIIDFVLTDLILDQDEYTLEVGETHQTVVTAVYNDQSQIDVTDNATYYSSDPIIAAVDSRGQVTAIASGTATITASYEDKTKTATVTVQNARPSFALRLNAEPASVVGDGHSQITITAGITSAGGNGVSGIPVTFHSSNNTRQDITQTTDEQGNVEIIITALEIQGTTPINEIITATAQDTEQGLVEQKSITIRYLPASVKGTVVNQVTGRPVAGATVSIAADFNNDGNIDFTATSLTGSDGTYQITVPRGNFEYQINIQMPVQIGDRTTQLNLTQTASVGKIK